MARITIIGNYNNIPNTTATGQKPGPPRLEISSVPAPGPGGTHAEATTVSKKPHFQLKRLYSHSQQGDLGGGLIATGKGSAAQPSQGVATVYVPTWR